MEGSSLGFEQLPPEVVNTVPLCCDKSNLRKLRLTSKTINAYASRLLFRHLTLRPEEKSLQHWENITQHASLHVFPRHVTFLSTPEISAWWLNDVDWGLRARMNKVIVASLCKSLPGVTSLKLVFSSHCRAPERTQSAHLADSPQSRIFFIENAFRAIQKRHDGGEKWSKILSLTIENLQNWPTGPDTFIQSNIFRSVIAQLTGLHLNIARETSDEEYSSSYDTCSDYDMRELRTFLPHLESVWLAPCAENLTELSLYAQQDNWGALPDFFSRPN